VALNDTKELPPPEEPSLLAVGPAFQLIPDSMALSVALATITWHMHIARCPSQASFCKEGLMKTPKGRIQRIKQMAKQIDNNFFI
jgi:hypothetical protein